MTDTNLSSKDRKVSDLSGADAGKVSEQIAGRFSLAIPDVLYAVSARVQRYDVEGWRCTVDLPTFYLDSRVQGITGEDHAREIVRDMLARLGHDSADVQVSATLAPISDRSGS